MKNDLLNKYEITIGIECHVQLATKTKLFSGADNDARNKEPNSVVSPIDFALPGMLPVLNKEAINLAIKAGLALNSKVAYVSRFDRKHYFYPDLPKGYQTTQMYQPIIGSGVISVPQTNGEEKQVRIHHAHLEEDAGKLTHHSNYSLVDLNRAGTPLIEIVSEPDIHSAAEAKAYAQELYRLMTYSGVTLGDLYHGNMRFDVNISLALFGSSELGTRAEIKNLNSFKSIERAVEYEFNRQYKILEGGEKVVQETRGWDDNKQSTISQRSKEEAQDYRYMPDADIPPVILTQEYIDNIASKMPKLPNYYRQSWYEMGFDSTVVNALLGSQESAETVDRIKMKSSSEIAKKVGLWLITVLKDEADSELQGIESTNELSDDYLIELATMVTDNKLSSTAAKEVFNTMLNSNESPLEIAKSKNLIQMSDTNAIAEIVDAVLNDPTNSSAVQDIQAGNDKAIGFLVGQVMKLSKGSANPSIAQSTLRERISNK